MSILDNRPIVWTIAGSDSSGGAGIQADLHTLQALGVHACSVITAVTAQNSLGVSHIECSSPASLSAQLTALELDMSAQVIKLGMLGNQASINVISEFLQRYSGIIVCDPVMVATVGVPLLASQDIHSYCQKVLPHVTLLTPNLPEAEILLGRSMHSPQQIESAALELLSFGPQCVVIKGGHQSQAYCQDYYCDRQQAFWLTSMRQAQTHTHGSGCSFASAIAAALALGYSRADAFVLAKMYLNQAIRHARGLGQGPGPVVHVGWPQSAYDLPWLTISAQKAWQRAPFPNCGRAIGLYPVIDQAAWIPRLAQWGVDCIQLRIKAADHDYLEQQIKESINLAHRHHVRLFINDYWELAIRHGAYGVHLGQEDLLHADFTAIRSSGLRLGISTHNYAELARAHALHPSYIALGPVFATQSKLMSMAPCGLNQLRQWRKIVNVPLVAIGGINIDNCPSVLSTEVDGIAVISAITEALDPQQAVTQFQRLWDIDYRGH